MDSDHLRPIIGHLDAENINISPVVQEGEVNGLVIWTDNLSVVVGSMEEQ